jgi:nucleotide-binding universal stress UspA family protein
MALSDLLVHVDQTHAAVVRLRIAADLARRHGSRLTALYVRARDYIQLHEQSTAEFGLVPAADTNGNDRRSVQEGNDTLQHLAQQLAAIKLETGLAIELRSIEGVASAVVPQQAQFADLCIVGHSTHSDATSAGYTFSKAVLFRSGRPVLIVPASGNFATLGRHILVAWNYTRASARALNDALPLIERAEHTTVLTINPAQYGDRHSAPGAEQIVEHIRRHSASVEGLHLEKADGGSIADVIQEEAQRLGADMIAAGAFGHPKLWEQVMGGVTYDLLARMRLPVLMSY